jgi:signal transduction histidine kinase
LFNIEDRIKFIGGHVHIESTPGRGFSVTLDVPRYVTLPSEKIQAVMP